MSDAVRAALAELVEMYFSEEKRTSEWFAKYHGVWTAARAALAQPVPEPHPPSRHCMCPECAPSFEPAAPEPAECYSGARGGGKAYLSPEQQLRDALTSIGSTKAQELSAGDLMQVVCDVDSGRAKPAALSDDDLARAAEFLRSWRDEFRKPVLADGYTPLSDEQIVFALAHCGLSRETSIKAGRAIERAVRGQT
jgi:hypothetical protein